MLKSKRKKDPKSPSGSPSKKALASDYDHDQAINPEDHSTSGSDRKSWSGSRSSSRMQQKTKKPDEVSIKMPASTPKTRKRPRGPSRFSLRSWLLSNPLFPPPFGVTAGPSSPKNRTKSETGSGPPQGAHGGPEVSWRDNASACSSVQGPSSNSGVKECPLCMAECTLDQFPHLRNCPHLFCMECLHTYTKLEIHEGRVNLKCPQCNELIHPNGKILRLSNNKSNQCNRLNADRIIQKIEFVQEHNLIYERKSEREMLPIH